ncbi:MAG: glycosyltransferase family 4 protein [Candidatus Solibacter sp.]
MNLLVLDQFSDLGGAQQNLLEFLPALRQAGWSAQVGLPGEGPLFARLRTLGFPVERIACGPYQSGTKSLADLMRFTLTTPLLAWQIRRMARRSRAEAVYLNGPRLIPAAAMAELDLPVLFHCHSYLGPGSLRTLAGTSLGHMKAWVSGQCEYVTAPWREFVTPQRVSVIHIGVPGPPNWPVRPSGGPPHVGCIGRIAPEKGQREFVAAAARIHQALPQCRFTIYGAPLFGDRAAEAYAAEVRAAAEGLPITFAGWVDDIYACLAELDLLLVPSTGHEATTRVILEAFAAGVTVITFPTGGIREVVDDGVNGVLVRDVDMMAHRAIELLTGDARHLIRMAHTARATWMGRFRPGHNHQQMLSLLRSMSAAGDSNH